MQFTGFPTNLLCDEVVQTTVEFTNCGQCSLQNLHIASPYPELFSFGFPVTGNETKAYPYQSCKENDDSTVNCQSSVVDVSRVSKVPIPEGVLAPGNSAKMSVWVQGCRNPGKYQHEVLFYYQSGEKDSTMG